MKTFAFVVLTNVNKTIHIRPVEIMAQRTTKEQAMFQILLIDDEHEILELNRKYLLSKNYNVFTADCHSQALACLRENPIDCIVLDVLMPDVSGFDLCQEIKKISDIPVIFLSCKDHEEDKIAGIMSGGDDYLTKPFSMRELEARIFAQLRNRRKVLFDEENKIIFFNSKSIKLSQTEFNLFALLFHHKDRILSSEELYALLNSGEKDESNSVAVYIRRLRNKLQALGDGFGMIETVRGEGYRFRMR